MAVNSIESPIDIRQRRSATVGSIGNGGSSRRASLLYEEPPAAPVPQRGEAPRLSTLVPLVTRVNRFRRRPMSMHHTGAQPLVSTEPLPNVQAQQLLSNRTSNEILNQSPPQRTVHRSPSEAKSEKRTSSYVDAGVQTDAPPPPSPMQPTFHEYRHRHTRDSSSVSSTSSVFTSYSSELSTRRSSIADDHHSAKPQYRQQTYNHVPNPVFMGRMQDYFRASGYRLGDSFQF